jgi:hypothetical protein
MPGAPKVIAVRVVAHPDEPARKIADVLLSTQTFTPSGSVVVAVATPPASPAPTRKAAITFVEVRFISISFVGKGNFTYKP